MKSLVRGDAVIVGAGPAGMAAAIRAAEGGRPVTLVDDNLVPGGQIWRGGVNSAPSAESMRWFRRLENVRNLELLSGSTVIAGSAQDRVLTVERESGDLLHLGYRKLILATGARELFLPFPGWTLPNVMGVGGLQALVKTGLPVNGKRIIVAGTGPLLLQVAAYLRQKGAVIACIAEQAPMNRLLRFAASLPARPGKIRQWLELRTSLFGIKYLTGCYVQAANGSGRLESVQLTSGGRSWEERCNYLAVAYGFVPNTELAQLLGCRVQASGVETDDFCRTSVADVLGAGETTGVGGVDLSIVEGEVAGHAAAEQWDRCEKLQKRLRHARAFAAALNRSFALSSKLRSLPRADTIVCRCEDVRLLQLKTAHSWRSAKLYTRLGMGPCQGRICGPACEFLLGWRPDSIRTPLYPTRIDNLI